ncbi:MAG: hypothetical protein ACK4F9_01765 [Brevinematia bacterium]
MSRRSYIDSINDIFEHIEKKLKNSQQAIITKNSLRMKKQYMP